VPLRRIAFADSDATDVLLGPRSDPVKQPHPDAEARRWLGLDPWLATIHGAALSPDRLRLALAFARDVVVYDIVR
jgi:hypothetical protein